MTAPLKLDFALRFGADWKEEERAMKKALLVLMVAATAAFSQAVTFTFVQWTGNPALNAGLVWGTNPVFSGSSLTMTPSNAYVGDPRPTSFPRFASFGFWYDVTAGSGQVFTGMNASFAGALSGPNSQITMTEQFIALDSAGNELFDLFPAGLTGTVTPSNMTFSGSVTFTQQVTKFRVKKSFTLFADTTAGFDLAQIQHINQSVQVVPEPATMTALGLGAAALMRRRRNRK